MSRLFQSIKARRDLRRSSRLEEHQDNRFVIRGTVAFVVILLCSLATLNLHSAHSHFNVRHVTVRDTSGSVDDKRSFDSHRADERQQLLDFLMKPTRKTRRSVVSPDEFYLKSPPSSTVDSYFYYTQPDWNKDAARLRLRPKWECSSNNNNNNNNTKVVALQMFRSASSTLRAFFRAYAKACDRSMALISQCIDLGLEFLGPNDIWRNGQTSPQAAADCLLNAAFNRSGQLIASAPLGLENRLTTAFVQQFDIVAGHVPLLGRDAYWWNNHHVQYVVLLRHPLEKFVSQVLYTNQAADDIPIPRAVALVNRTAHNKLSRGTFYESLANYFITPSQIDWVRRHAVEWTPEQRMNLSLSNLFGHPILVGLTNKLPESVQMLAYVFDTSNELPQIVNYFSSADQQKAAPVVHLNRTKMVVAAIAQNPNVAATVRALLQYEMVVYNAALQLHNHQYKWMLQDMNAQGRNNGAVVSEQLQFS